MSNYTAEQIALREHIRAENARFEAQCKASGATWWAVIVDDLDYWASCGVTTVAAFRRDQLLGEFSDTYKSENGFRPDLSRWSEAAMEQWLKDTRARNEAKRAQRRTQSAAL